MAESDRARHDTPIAGPAPMDVTPAEPSPHDTSIAASALVALPRCEMVTSPQPFALGLSANEDANQEDGEDESDSRRKAIEEDERTEEESRATEGKHASEEEGGRPGSSAEAHALMVGS